MRKAAVAVVLLWMLGVASADANPVRSLYTIVELKSCKLVKRHRDGNAWRCEGLPGYHVYVAEGDHRQFVSAGKNVEHRRAAAQTLGPFNTIFERGSDRATIEWRFAQRTGRKIPYAMIVRYHTSQPGHTGDVLVVSKIGAEETCHVAYIDAVANADAIALARRIADEQARTFDCKQEPRAAGEQSKPRT